MADTPSTQKEGYITPVKPTSVLGDESIEEFKPSSLFGTNRRDVFVGGPEDDTFFAAGGNDALLGDSGNDTLDGERGNDTLYGEFGDDILYGDHGNDRLYGGFGKDIMDGGHGKDILYGGDGNDKMYGGRGHDKLYGDAGNDKLYGDDGNDRLEGGTGDDILRGGEGRDSLYGNEDNDFLLGNIHDKVLHGGAGDDFLQLETNLAKKVKLQDILVDINGGEGMDVLLLGVEYLPHVAPLLKSEKITHTEMIVVGSVDRDSVSDMLAHLKIIDMDNDGKYELHGWQALSQQSASTQAPYAIFTKHVGADELTLLIHTLYLQNF